MIKNIIDPGVQGGTYKVLFGKLNDKDVAIKILINEEEKKKLRFFDKFLNVLMALDKVRGVVELYLFDILRIEGKKIQYIVMKKYVNGNISMYKKCSIKMHNFVHSFCYIFNRIWMFNMKEFNK